MIQAQFQKLEDDFAQSRQDHLKQLKTTVGEARFKVLDDWARQHVLPSTGYKKMTKEGKK